MTLKKCKTCGSSFSSRSKTDQCMKCRQTCQCSNKKDYRADLCRSCANRKIAIAQWRKPSIRQRMLEAIRETHKKKRCRFLDLTVNGTPWIKKLDGRYFYFYWEGNKKRYLYRYQLVWILAHGKIPEGHSIHHKNGDPSDDRLENLELLTLREHSSHHSSMQPKKKRKEFHCKTCGKKWKALIRPDRPQKYCSVKCWRIDQRSSMI